MISDVPVGNIFTYGTTLRKKKNRWVIFGTSKHVIRFLGILFGEKNNAFVLQP